VFYPFDPSLPCPFHPGSEGKLACLTLRRERNLPLWVEGDVLGARQVCDAEPSSVSQKSLIELRLIGVLSWEERPMKKLAHLAGYTVGQHIHRALWLLRDAGVVIKGRRGWRLAEV